MRRTHLGCLLPTLSWPVPLGVHIKQGKPWRVGVACMTRSWETSRSGRLPLSHPQRKDIPHS